MVKEGVYMDRISYNDIDFNKLMIKKNREYIKYLKPKTCVNYLIN